MRFISLLLLSSAFSLPAFSAQLIVKHSNRCIDIGGVSQDDGAAAVQWDCTRGLNQDFDLVDGGDGYVSLRAKHSGKCLDLPGASQEWGAGVIQYGCNGADNQKFKLVPVEGGGSMLQTKHSNLCLDIWGWDGNNGGRLTQSNCHGGGNQTFTILRENEMLDLAKKFAPLMQFHRNESYFPSSVEKFAENTHVVCDGQKVRNSVLDIHGLDMNWDKCNLVSNTPLSSATQRLPFFHGQDPRQGKSSVQVSVYQVGFGITNIQYAFFFPYNYGKRACFSVAPNKVCLGERVEMGSHVGDWETVTLQVRNGQLHALRIGAHGNRHNIEGDALKNLEYQDGRLMLYFAEGSHGIYTNGGRHEYKKIPTGDALIDNTERGISWNSAEHINLLSGREIWLQFRGRWGNPSMGRNACDLTPIDLVDKVSTIWNPIGDLFNKSLKSSREYCQKLGLANQYELDAGPWTQSFDQDRGDLR